MVESESHLRGGGGHVPLGGIEQVGGGVGILRGLVGLHFVGHRCGEAVSRRGRVGMDGIDVHGVGRDVVHVGGVSEASGAVGGEHVVLVEGGAFAVVYPGRYFQACAKLCVEAVGTGLGGDAAGEADFAVPVVGDYFVVVVTGGQRKGCCGND